MNPKHIVQSYDTELTFLDRKIAEMGNVAQYMIENSISAIIHRDKTLAQKVIEIDSVLDLAEREVNEKAIALIAKRQPMAVDLREITGSIRIASDLERIGDMGKNIAKRVSVISELPVLELFHEKLKVFSSLALSQVKEVLKSYASREVKGIEIVRNRDDKLDFQYTALFREILTHMMEDPCTVTPCTHLLFCAKNIERIGDHATNIAETVYFMVTGKYMDWYRPKDDLSYDVTLKKS